MVAAARLMRDALAAARRRVEQVEAGLPGFEGAFLFGSAAALADDEPLPATSDVDLVVVLSGPDAPRSPGKLRKDGVLLDVTYAQRAALGSVAEVLSHYHLGPGVRGARLVADPTGWLGELQAEVVRGFAGWEWVERRVDQARLRVVERLALLEQPGPLHEHVMAWLFAAGGLPHVLLTAALEPPTVRRRYVAQRALLARHGRLDLHEALLGALGSRTLGRATVERHLAAVERAFDAAAALGPSPLPFSSDVTPLARPIAIDGSRALIAEGLHREATFWIAVTACRCQAALAAAGGEAAHADAFRALLDDLGDLDARAADVQQLLPVVEEAAATFATG